MADGHGLIEKYLKEFSIGGLLGGISGGTFLFTSGSHWYHLVWEWIVRVFFTSLIALCSGYATAYSKDLYENYKKYKKQKQIDYEKRKRSGRNGKAA